MATLVRGIESTMAESLVDSAHSRSTEEPLPPADRSGSRKRQLSNWLLAFLYVWATVSLLWQAIEMNLAWFTEGNIIQRSKAVSLLDIDQNVLLHHVESHHSFASTFIWWHDAWLGQIYPWYWRPLTMLSFWTEYHLFGAYRFDRWQSAEIVFHVIF